MDIESAAALPPIMAGIGGGDYGDGGTVKISGGKVTATGGGGIGAGLNRFHGCLLLQCIKTKWSCNCAQK